MNQASLALGSGCLQCRFLQMYFVLCLLRPFCPFHLFYSLHTVGEVLGRTSAQELDVHCADVSAW